MLLDYMLLEARSSLIGCALPNLSGLRLLVVDNDADTRFLFTLIFEEKGADVTAVDCVPDAIAAIANVKPHLLISALSLPGEDGCSLIRKVRCLEAKQGGKIPAIAVTTLPRAMGRSYALLAGFQDYLVKPVNIDELIRAAMSLTRENGVAG
jgi:CheY-like chemotaxis protein